MTHQTNENHPEMLLNYYNLQRMPLWLGSYFEYEHLFEKQKIKNPTSNFIN